jgi:hypothetical protein
VVRSIPRGKTGEDSSLPDMQGAWIILQPIVADMQLVQSGHLVSGTYCSAEVKGTIEGTLFKEGEEIMLIGKWADQLGSGGFRVSIGNTSHNREKAAVGRTIFQGNWKHSKSQSWDGVFMGEKR